MYEIVNKTVGLLEPEEISVVEMPRSRFIELIEETLEYEVSCGWTQKQADAVRDELMPIAETMDRFPLETWINPTRGCGCLVGEYLVATAEIERAELVKAMLGDGDISYVGKTLSYSTVAKQLEANPLQSELLEFGQDIDRKLRREVRGCGDDTQAVEFV